MDGSLDWMIADRMNQFLDMIEDRYPNEHVAMILDGANSHRSKDLKFRDHVSLIRLPPYSPKLNSVELLWDELREKEFTNKVFASLPVVVSQIAHGMNALQANQPTVKSLSAWPWIVNAITSS
jgi:hypothetical protein